MKREVDKVAKKENCDNLDSQVKVKIKNLKKVDKKKQKMALECKLKDQLDMEKLQLNICRQKLNEMQHQIDIKN